MGALSAGQAAPAGAANAAGQPQQPPLPLPIPMPQSASLGQRRQHQQHQQQQCSSISNAAAGVGTAGAEASQATLPPQCTEARPSASAAGASPVPEVQAGLTCPITFALMQDPVLAADGHTYERAAIEGGRQAEWSQARGTAGGWPLPLHPTTGGAGAPASIGSRSPTPPSLPCWVLACSLDLAAAGRGPGPLLAPHQPAAAQHRAAPQPGCASPGGQPEHSRPAARLSRCTPVAALRALLELARQGMPLSLTTHDGAVELAAEQTS